MTTISNHHNGSITISSAAYPSPVTVTSTGEVHGSAGTTGTASTTAVDMVTSGASLQNAGYIYGGFGGYGTGGSSGRGGGGVDMSAAGSITNTGTIKGGYGHFQSGFGINAAYATITNALNASITGGGSPLVSPGYVGGTGISASHSTIVNYGTISGGAGMTIAGDGVDLGAGSTLSNRPVLVGNDSTIRGGAATNHGHTGGIGVSIAAGATLHNAAYIVGGNGFNEASRDAGGYGAGGAGVYLAAGGTLTNTSTRGDNFYAAQIFGGNGGKGGGGGDGVVVAAGASFTNEGGIWGGTTGSSSQRAGAGVYLHAGASLTNDGNGGIIGGRPHIGPHGAYYSSYGGGDGVDLAANAQLINNALIFGGALSGGRSDYTVGIGVSLAAGATVTNSATGIIMGGGHGAGAGAAIGTGSAGGYVGSNAVLVNLAHGAYTIGELSASIGSAAHPGIFGGNAVVGGAGVVLNGGTLVNAGLIVGGYNGYKATQANSTNRADAVQFGSQAGTLVVESGFDFIGNVVAVSGVADVLEVSGTSTAALSGIGTQFQNFADITFASGAAWTIAGNTGGLAGGTTISGFAHADTIDLTGFAATSKNYVAGTGLVLSDGSQSVTLDITGSFKTADFSIASDGAGGTLIEDTTPCYCPGTLIRTRRGQKKVEKLKIGDQVMTAAGVARPIKWIGRRSYGGRFVMGRQDILPVCIKAGALDDNVPQRDLWISPHHAMFLDGVLIEAKDLINGVSIVQAAHVDKVEYVHIELDSHDVIIAEGALSETFIDDDSRGMFHNAHEYGVLYPEAARAKAQYCAPRRDEGYEVEAARRRIALRAGLRAADEHSPTGPLRGYVDVVGADRIAGWAQHADRPEAPVCLDIFAGGRLIGQTLANQYREDLEQAKLGSGRHGFTFTPPPGLAFAPDAVEVRRSLDGAALAFGAGSRRAPHRKIDANVRLQAPHQGAI